MSKILVVVDMQPSFTASYECRDAVREKVSAWKGPVIVLEFEGESPTFPDIWQVVRKRYKFALVSKARNSGASEVLAVARLWCGDDSVIQFELCGVNLSWCVHETARGLAEAGHAVRVDVSACADNYSGWLNPETENGKQQQIVYVTNDAQALETVTESA